MVGCLGGRGGIDGGDDAEVDSALLHAGKRLNEHLSERLHEALLDRGLEVRVTSTILSLCKNAKSSMKGISAASWLRTHVS